MEAAAFRPLFPADVAAVCGKRPHRGLHGRRRACTCSYICGGERPSRRRSYSRLFLLGFVLWEAGGVDYLCVRTRHVGCARFLRSDLVGCFCTLGTPRTSAHKGGPRGVCPCFASARCGKRPEWVLLCNQSVVVGLRFGGCLCVCRSMAPSFATYKEGGALLCCGLRTLRPRRLSCGRCSVRNGLCVYRACSRGSFRLMLYLVRRRIIGLREGWRGNARFTVSHSLFGSDDDCGSGRYLR